MSDLDIIFNANLSTNMVVLMTSSKREKEQIMTQMYARDMEVVGRVVRHNDKTYTVICSDDPHTGAKDYSLVHLHWYNNLNSEQLATVKEWETHAKEIITA